MSTSFGFSRFLIRKDIHSPRVRFQFKTRSELEELGRGDRTAYFEDMLAALYSRRDDLDEEARDHLARVITDCLQFGHAWKKRLPDNTRGSIPASPDEDSVRGTAGKT